MAKTWREKLNNGRQPETGPTQRTMAGITAGQIMLVPTPCQVKDYIEAIPKGQVRSIDELKLDLAKQNGAEVTCPLCTGIFLRIVAEAALDEQKEGTPVDKITPFWRVLDAKSKTAKKLSCGPDFLTQMRESEA